MLNSITYTLFMNLRIKCFILPLDQGTADWGGCYSFSICSCSTFVLFLQRNLSPQQ